MKTTLRHLPLLACLCLPLCCLLIATPLRAEDNDGDPKPGFFHRLGNSLFKGTRKLERSDTVETPGAVRSPKDKDAPLTSDSAGIPGSKKASSQKKPVPTVASHAETEVEPAPVVKAKTRPAPSKDAAPAVSKPPVPPAPSEADPKLQPADSNPAVTSKDKDASPASQTKDYPIAAHAAKPGFVKSPYPPFNMLDATGMISGTLARDPTTGKIFRVP